MLPKTLRCITLWTSQSEVDCRHLLEFPDLEICVLDTRIVHTEALAQMSNLRWLVLYNRDKVEGLDRVHPADLTEYRALRKALKRVFCRARGEPYYFVRPQSKRMETLKFLCRYEPSLIHTLVDLLPEDVKAYNHVYSFTAYDNFVHQVMFAIFLSSTSHQNDPTINNFLREAFHGSPTFSLPINASCWNLRDSRRREFFIRLSGLETN